MATTPNYSWPTPDDTDLVRDGAEAIRDLGDAIDNTVFNLPAPEAFTVLASGTLSGASVDITNIPQDFVKLYVQVQGAYISASSSNIRMRLNNRSVSGDYLQHTVEGASTSWIYRSTDAAFNFSVDTTSQGGASFVAEIHNYNQGFSFRSNPRINFFGNDRAGASYNNKFGFVKFFPTTLIEPNITEINIQTANFTFSGGTYAVYGVK